MCYYFKRLLKKVPGTIILNIVTNNRINKSSNNVLSKTLSLKQRVKKSLPESKIIISNVIERLDNGKAALSVKRSNKHLSSLEVDIVDNSNISKEIFGKKGLHLNLRGSGKLAKPLSKKSRTCKKKVMLEVFKIIFLTLREMA